MLPVAEGDKKLYSMIVGYVRAGGDPGIRFVQDFLKKYQIDSEKFVASMLSLESETIVERLRRLGMI